MTKKLAILWIDNIACRILEIGGLLVSIFIGYCAMVFVYVMLQLILG